MVSRATQSYQEIVSRVGGIARAQAGEPLHIPFLCRRCNVTQRTLRKAFKAVCGATPYRYLRAQRLHAAREALLHATSAETVTSIATDCGFWELGRFSIEYRAAFGERPSETLRRAASADCTKHRNGVGRSPARDAGAEASSVA
jgi:transcriptional regulator GlxA family with amidase domain